MKTSNWHPTPMYNPWNKGLKLSNSHVQPMDEGLKPSNSHIQPMEQRPQTVQLPHTTHGMKASNPPQSTESPALLDRPIGAIFQCLIGSKRPVYTSQLVSMECQWDLLNKE